MRSWWTIFDVDDVLYDATSLKETARENAVLAMIEAGLPLDFDTVMGKLTEVVSEFGEDYPRHLDVTLSRLGLREDPRVIAAGVVAYHDTKRAFLRPKPGIFDLLLSLRERGVGTAVSTPGLPIKDWEKIIRLGLHHLFEMAWFGGGDSERLARIVDELGVPADRVIYVSARPEGVDGAKEVGIKAIRFLSGRNAPRKSRSAPDGEVSNAWELKKLVLSLLGG